MLQYMLDEDEFLSPHGIRSLSKKYGDDPFAMHTFGDSLSVSYVPGESKTYMFGGQLARTACLGMIQMWVTLQEIAIGEDPFGFAVSLCLQAMHTPVAK